MLNMAVRVITNRLIVGHEVLMSVPRIERDRRIMGLPIAHSAQWKMNRSFTLLL